MRARSVIVWTLLALLPGAGSAAESWRAGVAKAVITPVEPIWMAGYGDRTHPSEGVLRDLYVKALALEAEPGAPLVIVTAEVLGYPRALADAVAARCEKQFGLTRDRLVLSASHTHSGPVVSRRAFPVFNLKEKHWQVIDRYSAFLVDKTVEVVGAALRDLAPAKLQFEQGVAGIAVNRRRVRGRRDLAGPVDQDVPVISVQAGDGALRAVLFGYACHATVLNTYQISGDWPGFAQEEIEKAHAGSVALFVQGCGADANPLPRRSVELARTYGQVLAAAVNEVLRSKMRPLEGPTRTAYGIVQAPFHSVPAPADLARAPRQVYDTVQNYGAYDALLQAPRQRVDRFIEMLGPGEKLLPQYPYPVQVWQLGRGLKFIALAGEVVVDYSLRLKGQYGWDSTWVAGYSNDVFGYTPSARVLREGDYEAIQSGHASQFSPAIEELIVEKVADLVELTGPVSTVRRRQ